MDLTCILKLFQVRYARQTAVKTLRKTKEFISYINEKVLLPLIIDAMTFVDSPDEVNEEPCLPTSTPNLFGFSMEANSKKEKAKEALNMFHKSYSGKANIDPLKWWKDNAVKFPYVAVVARAYLSIPGSQIENERVFSVAGILMNLQQIRLAIEKCSNLILSTRTFLMTLIIRLEMNN